MRCLPSLTPSSLNNWLIDHANDYEIVSMWFPERDFNLYYSFDKEISWCGGNEYCVIGLFLDVVRIFDMVEHGILLMKSGKIWCGTDNMMWLEVEYRGLLLFSYFSIVAFIDQSIEPNSYFRYGLPAASIHLSPEITPPTCVIHFISLLGLFYNRIKAAYVSCYIN